MAAHRYWRLFSVYNNGYAYTNVCELEMFTSLGGSNVCAGGTAFASSEYPGWEAAKAFDGVKTGDQGWSSLSSGTQANQWVGYDFGADGDVEIEQVAITARTNATGNGGLPRFFAIEWSDDGIIWTQKGYIPPQTSWGANETRTFDIVNEISAEMSAVSLASRSFTHRINRPASFKKSTTGGDGSLGGTVLESSTPVEGAIITVFDETTHAVAGQGTTNIIGEWVIDNINPNKTYFAVAKHPDDLWEMKISSRRKPSRVNPTIKTSVLLGEHSSAAILTAVAATDPYYANVVLLLHFEGANGAPTFTDSSSYARTSTAYDNAQLTTTSPIVGTSSGLFDGSGDYVKYAHNSADDIGTGAFCIEFSFVATALSSYRAIFGKGPYLTGYTEWDAFIEDNNNLHFYWGTRGTNQTHLRLISPVTFVTGTRYDCSIGRDASGNWYGFVNGAACTQYQFSPTSSGVSYGSVTTGTYNNAVNLSPSGALWIGDHFGGGLGFAGRLDELRFTVGEVRNTSGYTPTLPFPNN